jgi:hypothetical protein
MIRVRLQPKLDHVRDCRFVRLLCAVLLGLSGLLGCRAPGTASPAQTRPASRANRAEMPIRRVVQVFDQRPWLNLDAAGDRNFEGIAYRVFLDDGRGRGALREGTLHVEMYRIRKSSDGMIQRDMVSDWHYATRDVPRIAEPGMLGPGYFLHLRWARKDIIGSEIEVVTMFEDPDGRIIRSGTKRLRVPKYD